MIPLVDIQAQHKSLEAEIMAAIKTVVSDSAFINGSQLLEFERKFADLHGLRFGLGVASGSDALNLAFRVCGIGPDDEVVTVVNTWISTAFAASHLGAKPVFTDIDPNTGQMDPVQLESVITERTKAVVPVHMYGHPAPMIEISEICRNRGISIIEDVAQSPMASLDGRLVGTFSDVACFSFYPSKNLGCLGDGGAVLTDDEDHALRLKQLSDYGQSAPHVHEMIGFNSRLDNLQAAILNIKIEYLGEWNQRRRDNAEKYAHYLADLPVKTPEEAPGVRSVYHLYVVQLEDRDECLKYLRDHGIMAQRHYANLIHLQPCYAHLGFGEGDFPVAEAALKKSLSLPMFAELTENEIKTVADVLRDFYTN